MVETSIIIAAYNEKEYIGRLLDSLLIQTYKDFEVILADDGSTDNTRDIAEKYSKKLNLKVLKQNHKGPGAARNLGAKKAKGEFLVILDADMVCDKNTLRDLILPLKAHKDWPGTVHNIELSANPENIWSRCAGRVRKDNKGKEELAFRAIRKQLFLKSGGYDSSKGYMDDFTIAPKIGNAQVVSAVLYHNNPESLREIYKHEKWIGNSCPLNSRFFLKNIVLPAIILVLLIGAAILGEASIKKTVFVLFLLSAAILLLMSISKSMREKDAGILLFLPAFYLVRISGRLAGILKKVSQSNSPK